eukprot:4734092-Prymnesium_polylepis.1
MPCVAGSRRLMNSRAKIGHVQFKGRHHLNRFQTNNSQKQSIRPPPSRLSWNQDSNCRRRGLTRSEAWREEIRCELVHIVYAERGRARTRRRSGYVAEPQ